MELCNCRRNTLSVFIVLWLAVCSFGLWILLKYQTTSGKASSPPARWPAGSSLSLSAGRNTLILFAHPHCPCTRASLDSLDWTMTRSRGKIAAYAVFFKPSTFPKDWEETDLWTKARAIPGVKVLSDENGSEARRFGVETSGESLVYDSNGRLMFHGGITGSRGHFGDNPGRDAVISIVQGRAEQKESPVFGCSLLRVTAERGEGKSREILKWIRTITEI